MERKQKGNFAENEACRFLIRQGYSILEKNFRFGHKEIDIIAWDKNTLVFIEVRSRIEKGLVLPEESIGMWKQKNIILTAQFYLKKKRWNDLPCRFDVVRVLYNKDSDKIKEIDLIRDAFCIE